MPSKKKATIRDVARSAGVSISTVSRYMNAPGGVKPLTAINIKNAIRELNYEPNIFAQVLKSGRRNAIGIVMPHSGFFYGEVCSILSDYFFEHRYAAYVCESSNDGEKERFLIQELINQQVAGLVVAPCGQNTAYLQTVAATYPNMILFDRYHDIGCDAVLTTDYVEAAYKLTYYMLTHYKSDEVYCLHGNEYAESIQKMVEGTEGAFSRSGKKFSELHHIFNCRNTAQIQSAVDSMTADIAQGKRPVLIAYGGNFLRSTVVLFSRASQNMRKYIDIAGFVDRETLELLRFEFPCMVRDAGQMGIVAAQLLHKKIKGLEPAECSPAIHRVKAWFHFPD